MENPPIRILQRPCQTSNNQASIISKPPATVKTLEQREADYAAARRRIMGSDSSEPDGDDVPNAKGITKTSNSGNGNGGSTVSHRQSVSTMSSTTATPLMSIQATPASVSALVHEFGTSSATTSLTSHGVAQSRVTPSAGARQGFAVVNVAQKLQQQPQGSSSMTRSVIQTQQPHSILTASASSPSLFSNVRTANQPVPLFPSHTNAANTGLLPTPPGFNYSIQNATLNGGSGMHHSHSAAYALMQQFGLFQQHYQQALNGFQNHLISPTMSHTGASLSHFNFSVASQPTGNQKYTHPPTFN